MVRYFCDGKNESNYRDCCSEQFITHPNGEMQCAKCGKYVTEQVAKKIRFAQKYDVDNQLPLLKNKIAETNAKLLITIQNTEMPLSYDSQTYNNASSLGLETSFDSDSRIEIYKGRGNPFVAYYLREGSTRIDKSKGSKNPIFRETKNLSPLRGKLFADLLIISDDLPQWEMGGGSSTFSVPVKNTDQLVFTGATVGGITTGGFHTQDGGTHVESVTFQQPYYWRLRTVIPFDDNKTVSFLWSVILVYSHSNNYPHRYDKYFREYKGQITNGSKDIIWKVDNVAINRVHGGIIHAFSPSCPISQIYHDLIFGFHSDEEFYIEAARKAERNTKESLLEAGEMFRLLNDYKDSRIRSQTCFHDAQNAVSTQSKKTNNGGCYVATAVYGSYDCPQVWTLRRYRDFTLAETWYGRAFVRTYYAISPTLVKWFGKTTWFKNLWEPKLDRMIKRLNGKGVADTPYQDRNW